MNSLKLLSLLIVMTFTFQLKSQTATVEVLVSNFEGIPQIGETVLFENTQSKETIKGVSNSEGKFSVELPHGQDFLIKLKGVSQVQDYTEISIPVLEEGKSNYVFSIDIQFEPPQVFTLNQVYFDSGKASLLKTSFAELNELFEFLSLKNSTVVEIAGHTDNVGTPESNLALSKKRSESVKAYLVKKGIAANRIVAKGYGETEPVADNETKEGRQQNRRTEVRILED